MHKSVYFSVSEIIASGAFANMCRIIRKIAIARWLGFSVCLELADAHRRIGFG